MSVLITDTQMISDQTVHCAAPTDPTQPYGTWRVSWLPGVDLARGQAITAITLAETVAMHFLPPGSWWWPFINGWARELGLTGRDAVARASAPPTRGEGDGQ